MIEIHGGISTDWFDDDCLSHPFSLFVSFCGPMFASFNFTCNFLDLDRFCKVSKPSNNHILFFLAGSYSTP